MRLLPAAVLVLGTAGAASGQALSESELSNGTRLVVVAQPLADATTCAWYSGASPDQLQTLVSGQLTLADDLRDALRPDDADADGTAAVPAPAVIVAVGPTARSELETMLGRLLTGRPPAGLARPREDVPAEGGLERRLGSPGSDASLRFQMPLPPSDDPTRTAIEVLWELTPDLLAEISSGLTARVERDVATLRAMVDADLAELRVQQLRLRLARLAADPRLEADAVDAARRRVVVQRAARLERHPEGAMAVLERYAATGSDGVRELLFGTSGVTLDSVRAAAATWLPRHPGSAVLTLPPRVFNPRFAAPPVEIRLESDVSAAVLERGAAPLATMVLRPVVVPDVDGELSATVLARLAAELRAGESVPGWIEVTTRPAALEIAAPPDGFPELVEALQRALSAVEADETPVMSETTDPRRQALRLTSGLLGLGATERMIPSDLLRPANLAVGAVVPDAEAGVEALQKLLAFRSRPAQVGTLPERPRTRTAVAGSRSCMVAVVELGAMVDDPTAAVIRQLLAERARLTYPSAATEVMEPMVPGRRVLLILIEAEATLDELETQMADRWSSLLAPSDEQELAPLRRRAVAEELARFSGATGSARRCAALAAGARRWQPATEVEMAVLGVDPTRVDAFLEPAREFDSVETAGAGVLPIPEAPSGS